MIQYYVNPGLSLFLSLLFGLLDKALKISLSVVAWTRAPSWRYTQFPCSPGSRLLLAADPALQPGDGREASWTLLPSLLVLGSFASGMLAFADAASWTAAASIAASACNFDRYSVTVHALMEQDF